MTSASPSPRVYEPLEHPVADHQTSCREAHTLVVKVQQSQIAKLGQLGREQRAQVGAVKCGEPPMWLSYIEHWIT